MQLAISDLNVLLSEMKPEMLRQAMDNDPIGTLYAYSNPLDLEVAGMLASSLAYGQRKVFLPILRRLFSQIGHSPYDFVMAEGFRQRFQWLRYRFNTGNDVEDLCRGLRSLLQHQNSLESFFTSTDGSMQGALTSFVRSLRTSVNYVTPGLSYLIPDPAKGGACKRLNMFLRWMCRKDSIDLGVWSTIPTSMLVIPLDVHVHKVSRTLGLTSRSVADWRTAVDITQELKSLDFNDPLKYDFLLFSLGAWKMVHE